MFVQGCSIDFKKTILRTLHFKEALIFLNILIYKDNITYGDLILEF